MFLENKMENIKKNVLLIILLSMFFGVRLAGIGYDISNSDAGRWHNRSQNFLSALKTGDLKSTYQRYHPGVTLMWVNSVVKQAVFSAQLLYTNNPKTLENADWYPVLHGISKAVNILILGFLLGIQIKFIEILINKKTSLIYGLFVSLEPFLVGIDRWFHLTSFQTYFAFTSLLVFMVWFKNEMSALNNEKVSSKKKKTLFDKKSNHKLVYFSAVLFGFAVLSKITALVLAPVFLYFFAVFNLKNKNITPVLRFSITFLITLIILFPALVTDTTFVIGKIYNAFKGSVEGTIRDDTILGDYNYYFYFYILGFKLSFITLVVFILSIYRFFKEKTYEMKYFFAILIYLVIVLTAASQKIDRYIITVFPYILIICAFYISKLKLSHQKIFILFILVSFINVSYNVFPVYSAYYSPILGGTKKALEMNLYDNSGEYFAQAAFFLNQQGREKFVSISPDNNIDSFRYYYKGKITHNINDNTDYVLKSLDYNRQDESELLKNDEKALQKCHNLEKAFGPKDYNVVFIYKCEKEI